MTWMRPVKKWCRYAVYAAAVTFSGTAFAAPVCVEGMTQTQCPGAIIGNPNNLAAFTATANESASVILFDATLVLRQGDVVFNDVLPNGTTAISDILRFACGPIGNACRATFLSDTADETPAPTADQPGGLTPMGLQFTLNETPAAGAFEGLEITTYSAQAAGQIVGTYVVTSDTPEPAPVTLVLCGLAFCALLGTTRRCI
jgi:hypothetical protein